MLRQDRPSSETSRDLTHSKQCVEQQTEEQGSSASKDASSGLWEHVEERAEDDGLDD